MVIYHLAISLNKSITACLFNKSIMACLFNRLRILLKESLLKYNHLQLLNLLLAINSLTHEDIQSIRMILEFKIFMLLMIRNFLNHRKKTLRALTLLALVLARVLLFRWNLMRNRTVVLMLVVFLPPRLFLRTLQLLMKAVLETKNFGMMLVIIFIHFRCFT